MESVLGGFYDPNEDKIYAKPGTLTYYHEEGHRRWFKKGIDQRIQGFSWVIILWAAFDYGLSTGDLFLQIIFGIPFVALGVSEGQAWMYAFRKWWRLRE